MAGSDTGFGEQGIPFPVPPLIGLAWKIQFLVKTLCSMELSRRAVPGIEFPIFFPVSEKFAAEKGLQPTASTASWLEFLAVADLDGPPSSQLTARSQDLNNSDSSGVA
jgi:hypothetical protein